MSDYLNQFRFSMQTNQQKFVSCMQIFNLDQKLIKKLKFSQLMVFILQDESIYTSNNSLNLSCNPNEDHVSFSQTVGFGFCNSYQVRHPLSSKSSMMLDHHTKFHPNPLSLFMALIFFDNAIFNSVMIMSLSTMDRHDQVTLTIHCVVSLLNLLILKLIFRYTDATTNMDSCFGSYKVKQI